MSVVEASERFVALPEDESLANSAAEDVIVVEGLLVLQRGRLAVGRRFRGDAAPFTWLYTVAVNEPL